MSVGESKMGPEECRYGFANGLKLLIKDQVAS